LPADSICFYCGGAVSCIDAYNLIKSIWPSSELILIETPDDSEKFKAEIEEFKKRGIRGKWRPKIRGKINDQKIQSMGFIPKRI